MSFNAFRENKNLAKISEFTVMPALLALDVVKVMASQFVVEVIACSLSRNIKTIVFLRRAFDN